MYNYDYDVNAEVIAVGKIDGQRARLVAKLVDYSGDLPIDNQGTVPQVFIGYNFGRFTLSGAVNLDYFPVDVDHVVNAVEEFRWRFRDNWEEVTERWLRIMGAEGVSVQQDSLDQSTWGILIAAYGGAWRDMTGVPSGYEIDAMDTREFVNWLKGEVSEVYVEVANDDCECENCEISRAFERGDILRAVVQQVGADYLGNENCSLVWTASADWVRSTVYADPFDIKTDWDESFIHLREEFGGECDAGTYANV